MMNVSIDGQSLQTMFRVGDVIASGGPRARLEIVSIESDYVDVRPIGATAKRRLPMRYLEAVHNGFKKIDPKAVQRTIQDVFKTHNLVDDTWRENYMYGLVREFRRRASSEFSLPDEVLLTPSLPEGAKKVIMVNAYERSVEARALCLAHWGSKCMVCTMSFLEIYGPIGEGYIHVHHLTPLSEVGSTYLIDPINDLRPVCPNCHAMLHNNSKVLSIEELKRMVGTQSK